MKKLPFQDRGVLQRTYITLKRNPLGVMSVNTCRVSSKMETAYTRNTEVVLACDRLTAFIINNSAGAADTLEKARLMKKECRIESCTF